ncbi:pre-mRNA cleavage factor Im 25 kDa subunit 1 [Argentina anserina]|uniref:pre-mRNA cleavage factor Im 25 kDa subunit 1 n=1 Tax=Argentina anserina TaxID=57926 RepID=UPI0021765C5E|nr:pre-mRNA cleavage factor Im 25 kDa subunit 1 [Potentilla anserina]
MGEEAGVSVCVSDSNGVDHNQNDDQSRQLDIYPLSCYYFGSKEAIPLKDETLADRVQRLNSNYATYGLRTCVEAVILVELFKHPHILLLQVRNCCFKLPGGRLRPGESEVDGLKRKLSRKLCVNTNADGIAWEVGECLGVMWSPDFETSPCMDLPSSVRNPKECTKLYLVKLPESRKFIVPKNLKLLAIPLCQINKNRETYGPIISGVPEMLAKFTLNIKEA